MQHRRPYFALLVAGAALVAYGNAATYLTSYTALALPGGLMAPNLLATGLLVLWAVRRARLSLAELGLRWTRAPASAAWGAAVGGLMAVPALATFAIGPLLPGPVIYHSLAALSPQQFLWKVMVELPIATVLCEELAFRGVLQALFHRVLSAAPAIAATSLTFTLWHGVVNYRTILETNVAGAPSLVPLALAGGLAGVFGGGIVFSLLRHFTRSLAGSILAHWAVNATMLGALYMSRPL